jgi:O-acetyl-ADP-ribose deacetylase (regulator of RNase III)
MPECVAVVRGDITALALDAIVNAANPMLSGGGGVDGAIHRVAGPGLLAECLRLGGCPTGEARITAGHGLPARRVIHAVGPVWKGGASGEDALLAACYRASLALARDASCATIAFPAISTGAYGFPLGRATAIAVSAVLAWLAVEALPKHVTFCCFSEAAERAYKERLQAEGDVQA